MRRQSGDEIAFSDPELYERWMTAPTTVRFPGGESYADLQARVDAGIASLVEQHDGGLVVVVTHGGVVRVRRAHGQREDAAGMAHSEHFSAPVRGNGGAAPVADAGAVATVRGIDEVIAEVLPSGKADEGEDVIAAVIREGQSAGEFGEAEISLKVKGTPLDKGFDLHVLDGHDEAMDDRAATFAPTPTHARAKPAVLRAVPMHKTRDDVIGVGAPAAALADLCKLFAACALRIGCEALTGLVRIAGVELTRFEAHPSACGDRFVDEAAGGVLSRALSTLADDPAHLDLSGFMAFELMMLPAGALGPQQRSLGNRLILTDVPLRLHLDGALQILVIRVLIGSF